MSTPNAQAEIERLDLCYEKLTGRKFKASGLLTGREYAWVNFIRSGFTIHDLEVTILHIKRGILNGTRHEAAIAFRRLIADLGIFEDESATAYAERRNAKPHVAPKERVVEQARPTAVPVPTVPDDNPARHVSFWIEKMREAAK